LSYPPGPIYAGQDVTADELNAMSALVAPLTCATVSNTTTETAIGTVTIPAGDAGLVTNGGYQIRFWGVVSCTGTPTVTINVRLTSATGTLIGSSGSLTCRSGVSNAFLHARYSLMVTAAGSSGTFDGLGEFISNIVASSSATNLYQVQGTAINTTAAVTLVVTAVWGAANASNTVTGHVGTLGRI
jgi:hypothetical protein